MSLLRPTLLFLVLGLLCLAPIVLVGAEKSVTAAAPGDVIYPRNAAVSAGTSSADSGRGYSTILIVALLMAAGGGWLFWRGRTAPGGVAALRKLAIAETKSLGNRQYLVVATYEDKKYLLGVCPGRIDLLTPLDGAEKPRS